jgi:hypothetical protein
MARRATNNEGGESISGYFRTVFGEHPEWLKLRSNDKALQRWLDDHDGYTQVPDNVKTNLANIKSVLRKKRGRRGRRPAAETVEATNGAEQPVVVRLNLRGLEALEEHIDESLNMAKSLDRNALGDVIDLLRRARNQVVIKSNPA